MIDAKAVAEELHHARQVRMAAEAANTDIEEMIWEVQHAHKGGRCLAYFFAGIEQDAAKH